MNYDKIGDFITLKRKEKNLTQAELAKKIGVTDKAVSKWERGLGCPDVSILEILAKELDVSILELLKGREIENEVINVTEADDYIKESIKVTKDITRNKIIDYISKIIFYAVLIISVLFIIFSVNNHLKLNKGEYISFDDKCVNNEWVQKIESDLAILKNNQGTLTKEEQERLIKSYTQLINYYNNTFPCLIEDNKKYTSNDLMILFLEDVFSPKYPLHIMSDIMNVYKNHGYQDWYISTSFLQIMYSRTLVENAFLDEFQNKNQEYIKLTSANKISEDMAYFPEGQDYSYYISSISSVNTRFMRTYSFILEDIMEKSGIHE